MLKKLLSAIALVCFALCANAQELEQNFSFLGENCFHGIIPQVVTNGGVSSLFWISTKDDYHNSTKRCWNDLAIYDNNLEQILKIAPPKGIIPISYFNSNMNGYCMPASQRLFDNDNKYEYITPTIVESEYKYIRGISINQDDGTTLATINFNNGERLGSIYPADNDFPIEVLLIDDKAYLLLKLWKDDENTDTGELEIIRMYSFKMGEISTSIKKIKDIPARMKCSPTLPLKNESIKIDLADMKSPSKLSVVDMNGKVCFTQTIQANQKNVELSTSGMSAGMYIIRVTDGNKEIDNCRVIIR